MQTKDPKPEIMRLEELALQVKSGDIKLPKFQRPFVWKESDMLKLLDSIYKGYPIGSILIWNSSQPLMSERTIVGLEVNTEANAFLPTNYLLDGQQRLTTLCGALFWDGSNESSMWNIHFDLDEETFIHAKEPDLTNLFPLNKLIRTSDFINQCMKFHHHPKKDEYFKNSERLLKSIKDYKIAVVKIGDMTIDEVAPIFERINSTGRKLTMVDLMMAATWSHGFDLTNEIKSIKEQSGLIGFDGISDPIILRSISASANLGINKEDIQKLRSKKPTELSEAAQVAKDSIMRALNFLLKEIGIEDYGYIPYGFQFTYLAEYLRLDPTPSPKNIRHLIEWFWFTSITKYFGTSNTGQVSKDLSTIRSYAQGTRSSLFNHPEIDISRLLFDRFNLRNASSIAFAVLLNKQSPTKTLDGMAIDGSHMKLKSSKFFESYCPKAGGLERLNISKIIYPYLKSAQELREIKQYVSIETHILNDECIAYVKNDSPLDYVMMRAELISNLVQKLTGCSTTYAMPESFFETDYSGGIDDQPTDEL